LRQVSASVSTAAYLKRRRQSLDAMETMRRSDAGTAMQKWRIVI
jgi:hypothetical protein